ncbi:GntR family transcriptional regulator [Hydrogenophaga sp.]|uniref:FadR/GntR family transcriptional regulator n=1 Tax=Hydrogenophaga sp. TaxID=1904254 RepID=UPI0026067E93|nr:GntR family transcriptional regulator [Hydrogenophaga sp.]MCW5653170.1 FadR family transcriptional regulator [Hydrogenophaga sp.]
MTTPAIEPSPRLQFSKVKRRRVFEEICDQIRRKLARGEFRPGDKLPTERELAAEFSVGRPAVREALRTLESSGVLVLKKGLKGGAFVREGDPTVVTQSIHDLINLGHISTLDLMEARIVLTDSVVKLACERGTTEEFDAVERSIEISERLEIYGELEERLKAGTEFFRLIAVAAHNDALLLLVDSLGVIVRHMVLQVRPQTTAMIDERRRVLAALRERDAETAQREVRSIFSQLKDRLAMAEAQFKRPRALI